MAQEIQRIGFDSDQGYSEAVVVPALGEIFTTQFYPQSEEGEPISVGDPKSQTDYVLKQLESVLSRQGTSLNRLARLHICAKSPETVDLIQETLRGKFDETNAPAITFVVGALPHADFEVGIDAVAVLTGDSKSNSQPDSGSTLESTTKHLLPGPRVFISGQAESGEFEAGIRGTMQSLFKTLEFLGLSPEDIVQLKGFVQPMNRADEARQIMVESFNGGPAPPIVLVDWSSSLPIEIELVATAAGKDLRRGKWGESVEYITPPGMATSPVYSKLTYVDHPKTIYVSALQGTSGQTAPDQIHSIFGSLKEILGKAGSDLNHLVKATYYVSNDETSAKLNEIRPEYYDPARPPAASKAMGQGVGAENCGISIDMIAVPSQ